MATTLNERRIAILAADGVERVELEQPRKALDDAGARTVVVSITSGEIQARDHDLEDAGTFTVDQLVGAVSVDDYEALLLPGGTVNPDKLRMEPAAVVPARPAPRRRPRGSRPAVRSAARPRHAPAIAGCRTTFVQPSSRLSKCS